VTIEGRQILLEGIEPGDREGAEKAAQAALVEQLSAGIAANLRLQPVGCEPTPPITGPTVAEAVARYLAESERRMLLGKIKPETLDSYRLALGHFCDAFGGERLNSLAATVIEDWAAKPDWSPSTQNTYLGTVQQLFKAAGVALSIRRPPKESRGAEVVLTDEQIQLVLIELKKYKRAKGDLCELYRVLRETGARPQEIARLRVDGIDWTNACTRVREHKTRRHTGADRLIPFTREAMRILEGQREKYKSEGLLFRTRAGNAYRKGTIVRRLGEVSDRVGFRAIAYGMRHTAATRMLEAGVSDIVVAGVLGQKSTAMISKHYGHVNANSRLLKDAAEKASTKRPA